MLLLLVFMNFGYAKLMIKMNDFMLNDLVND